jgi:hypothetical protein
VATRTLVVCLVAVAGGCGEEDEPVATTTSGPERATLAERSPPASATAGEDAPGGREPFEIEQTPGPTAVTTAVLTRSGSPREGCAALVTERFVREAYGARAGCLAAREAGGLARSLTDVELTETGDRATGTVVPRGGPYNGVAVEVELVAGLRGWRVDSLVADVPPGP